MQIWIDINCYCCKLLEWVHLMWPKYIYVNWFSLTIAGKPVLALIFEFILLAKWVRGSTKKRTHHTNYVKWLMILLCRNINSSNSISQLYLVFLCATECRVSNNARREKIAVIFMEIIANDLFACHESIYFYGYGKFLKMMFVTRGSCCFFVVFFFFI